MSRAVRRRLILFAVLGLVAVAVAGCTGSDGSSDISVKIGDGQAANGNGQFALSLQLLIAITVLSLVPAILMLATSFTRIVVVLSLLRSAIGIPNLPPNQVLTGLALFLTLFVMQPVLDVANATAVQPYLREEIGAREALERVRAPFATFMLAQTRESDLDMFLRISGTGPVAGPEAVPFMVLAPAFVTSELKTAFQIGFLLFVPFLVIDLVVASVLMAMGMMMLSPMIISLPFKIMLFVLVDGWALIIGSLASSFAV